MASADELVDLAGSDDDGRTLPPDFDEDDNGRSLYVAALCSVLVRMMRVHGNVGDMLRLSQQYRASFRKLAMKRGEAAAGP